MVSRTLSRLKREGGISLEMPQQKTASSRLEGKISWVFSSCGSKLWFPLELRWGPQGPAGWPQESPVSGRVAKGLLEVHFSQCWVLGPHLELRPEPQVSSPVLTCISDSYGVSTEESGLVSCGDMHTRSPLDLEKQCQASSLVDVGIGVILSRCHRAVTPAIMF